MRFPLALLACLAFAAAASSPAHAASFKAGGSAEQVWATGLKPGTAVELLDAGGRTAKQGKADAQGAFLFREVKPGDGYRVRAGSETSDPLKVMTTDAEPADKAYLSQSLPSSGYGYITMRDGTKLSMYVHPPQDVTGALPTGYLPEVPMGPQPTLIEYSGYGYADPAGPQSGIAILANIMGFTVVDVTMRGIGCSGGAFDFFEPLQSLDGYDIAEVVARQPWVKGAKVGMMGISYGGISQLFTAQMQPPSLAAISPLSVIDATQTTLYPGGVLNTGFAVEWAKERQRSAQPAGPETGQGWAYKRIQEGDQTCKENQALRLQAADLLKKIDENSHYIPKVADPLAPVTFVDKIKVPTFMACQWQDEQTGGHCPTLVSRMTGTSKKWFSFTNGTHVDSLAPETFNRWYDFLSIYVADQAPMVNSARIKLTAPLVYQAAMGIDGVELPPDPIQNEPTLEGARAAFEAQPPVRVLFENGAGSDPGHPLPAYEASFATLPVPGTQARRWYFAADGKLAAAAERKRRVERFAASPKARTPTNFTGDTGAGENGLWTATPPYKWQQHPAGTALSYETEALAADVSVVGAGSVDAWVRSAKRNVDFQATVTEVRPDGKEVFVQSGWLRGNMRKLDRRKSTALEPVLTLRKRDVRPLPRRSFAKLTIPLYYQGHTYRKGSRIRVTISAPNGDQPIWAFAKAEPKRRAEVQLAFGRRTPSSLVLPAVPGVQATAALPPCPGLRAQPCRDYARVSNRRGR